MTVGQVSYDVVPDLSGFAQKVEAGLGSSSFKPIKVKVVADTSGTAKITQASAKAQAQQLAIATRGEAQLRAIRARGEQQRITLAQRTAAQQAAAQARATAAAERGSARQTAAAVRGAERQAQAAERAAARELAARNRLEAQQVRASQRTAAAAERSAAREAAAAERASSRAVAARGAASSNVGGKLLTAGAVGAAGIGLVIAQNAKFEKSVSGVAATSAEAQASIGALRAEAIKYGADTAFSATEAADAQAELIKANVSVSDTINGGLKGALDLAAAGSLGVADAAGIMATAMSQFNIPGTQASHVADLLAAAAGKAQGEVQDFAGALKYVGPVAASQNISIEQTTGALAELANAGILGEQAGTSLRSMLVSLTAPIGAGAKELDKYNINLRDGQGNFIGLAGAAGELQSKLGGLPKAERDAALARIFGKNSLTAATVLYEGGAAGIEKWTSAVNDSGFAARTAQTKMDNLSGDVEKLGGAFQSAFIGAASSSTGPLRTVTQAITGVVDTYNDASATFKSGSFIGIGLATAAAVGVGGVLKLGGALRDARGLANDLGTSLKGLTLKGGAVGLGIAAAAAVIGHFAVQQAEAKARTDDLTQSLVASKGAIDDTVAAGRAKSLEDSGALVAAQKLGLSIADVTQASLGNVDAQDRVNRKLQSYAEVAGGLSTDLDRTQYAQSGVAEAARKVQDAIGGGNDELKNAVAQYERTRAATEAASQGQGKLASAADQSVDSLSAAADAAREVGSSSALSASDVDLLAKSLFSESDAATAALDATIAYNNAVKGAGTIKGGGLSTNTGKGQANIALLEKEARAIKDRAKSQIQNGKAEKDVLATYEAGRKKLLEHAAASNADEDTVKKRTDALLETPKEVRTYYAFLTKQNQEKAIEALRKTLGDIPPDVETRVNALIDAGQIGQAKALLDSLVAQRTAGIDVVANGADIAKGNIGEAARDRRSTIEVGQKGAGAAGGAISAAAKRREALITAKTNDVPGANKTINNAARARKSNIAVTTSGTGAAASAIDAAARRREAIITVKTNDIHGATGGTATPGGFVQGARPGFSIGGSVWGAGTSTSDSIAASLANGEEVIRTTQAMRNRSILKTINAGGVWDIVPAQRRANGGSIERASRGTVPRSSTPAPVSSGPTHVVIKIDLGPELGGLRTIVADQIDGAGEYAATLGRMKKGKG